jgi:hypothetical protein
MGIDEALDILSVEGARLREEFGFAWTEQTRQAVHALRFRRRASGNGRGPAVVGIVGGASSGKSTVFNNLLGGRRASLVTIKSHATLGMILAAHRDQRQRLDAWLFQDRTFMPTLAPDPARAGSDLQGNPATATVLYHEEHVLSHLLLVDTPDFTSSAAEREGDITLSMLPWFDRLLVVVDHERWFDRQVIDDLARVADRLNQPRLVIFNRTSQGELSPLDRSRLLEQARHLAANRALVLDYYPGRGFRRFGPAVLKEINAFLTEPLADRTPALRRELAGRGGEVLAINSRRLEMARRLRDVLTRSSGRLAPTGWWECVTSVMAPEERDRLDSFSRLLGLSQMRDWMERQRRRLEETMSRVPWLRLPATPAADARRLPAEPFSRAQSGLDFFESQCERQRRRLNEDAAASDFWNELRWGPGRNPPALDDGFTESFRPRARDIVDRLCRAMEQWDAKVRSECSSLSPHVVGSLSAVLIGIAAILVAVPGPLHALTPLIAAGAIKAGLVKIGAAGVFGAFGGRSVARLVEIVREKLLASPEFNEVHASGEQFRRLLEEHAEAAAGRLENAAGRLTLPPGDPLLAALECLSEREGST